MSGRTGRPGASPSALRARAAKAAAGRRRTPAFVRRRTMPLLTDLNGAQEAWTFGYLTDVILTRDPWMHRLDIAAATGTPLHLTADHDGVIVANVVDEWAGRHGKDFELTLTGPAAGPGPWGPTGQPGPWTPSTSAGPPPGARPASAWTSS